jgi:hypothetical protein
MSVGVCRFQILQFCCKIFQPKIILTYNPHLKTDGVGAQLQRILAIRSLARNLNLGYLHTPIENIAVHPFDPYQSLAEMKLFLVELNHIFYVEETEVDREISHKIYERNLLKFGDFFMLLVESLWKRSSLLIKIVEPYQISEFDPKKYVTIGTLLPHFKATRSPTKTIAVHYRQGVGGKSVQIGEKLSRQLDVQYFVDIVKSILVKHRSEQIAIRIFTDAPEKDLEYFPPESQSHLWHQSPRFKDGQMSIEGFEVRRSFEGLESPIEVIRGGSPISAIQEMAGADMLVIGRSSLSYIAAILNSSGEIYFPSSFWHRPLTGWNVVPDWDY